MSNLVAVAYPDEATAREVGQTLMELQKEHSIELEDLAIAVRQDDGKIKLRQTFKPAASGAAGGALWGGLIGLIFFMPLLGAAIGPPAAMQMVMDLGAREICNVYGLTECYGNCSVTDAHDSPEVRRTTVGYPLPGMQIRVVDRESRRPLPDGAIARRSPGSTRQGSTRPTSCTATPTSGSSTGSASSTSSSPRTRERWAARSPRSSWPRPASARTPTFAARSATSPPTSRRSRCRRRHPRRTTPCPPPTHIVTMP